MGNATSSRPWLFRRPRLLAISAAGAVAVLVLAGTLTLAALNLRHVHASGTGPGGYCYMTTGATPACTFSGHNGWGVLQRNADCVYTNTWVYTSDNFARNGGTTTQSSWTYLDTYSYNSCTGDFISWGRAYDDTGTVQVSSTGNTLTAHGNLNGFTYNSYGTESAATYTVDLTWKFLGTPSREVSETHRQMPTFISNLRYTGTSGMAIVSGTLSDGTTNLAATPSTDAEWLVADSGTFVVVQR